MFWNYGVGIHIYDALTYDVMKSYLTRICDKKTRKNLYYIGNKGFYVIKAHFYFSSSVALEILSLFLCTR